MMIQVSRLVFCSPVPDMTFIDFSTANECVHYAPVVIVNMTVRFCIQEQGRLRWVRTYDFIHRPNMTPGPS